MKKNYEAPIFQVESFMSEGIMDRGNYLNVLSENTAYTPEGTQNALTFHTGEGNVLNSIDYSKFTN